jgi:hypothetical protein
MLTEGDFVRRIEIGTDSQHRRRERHVLLERIHGVRGMDDRVVCVEPMSGIVVDDAPGRVEPVRR